MFHQLWVAPSPHTTRHNCKVLRPQQASQIKSELLVAPVDAVLFPEIVNIIFKIYSHIDVILWNQGDGQHLYQALLHTSPIWRLGFQVMLE